MTALGALRFPTQLYEAYVFDLDGTIYLGEELLPGAKRTIEELRRREIPIRFLSNNATSDPAQVAAKLAGLGLPTDVAEIANTVPSGDTAILASSAMFVAVYVPRTLHDRPVNDGSSTNRMMGYDESPCTKTVRMPETSISEFSTFAI